MTYSEFPFNLEFPHFNTGEQKLNSLKKKDRYLFIIGFKDTYENIFILRQLSASLRKVKLSSFWKGLQTKQWREERKKNILLVVS